LLKDSEHRPALGILEGHVIARLDADFPQAERRVFDPASEFLVGDVLPLALALDAEGSLLGAKSLDGRQE
jgi:hypothetical protein